MQKYKIFQIGESGGSINIGVEFAVDDQVLDRNNLTFSGDSDRAQIFKALEDMLTGKVVAYRQAQKLKAALEAEVNVEQIVVPGLVLFDPPAGALAFPKTVALSASMPMAADNSLRYALSAGLEPAIVYRAPIVLTEPTTIYASIFDPGYGGITGRITSAAYTAWLPSVLPATPITKAAIWAAIPQADILAALADTVAYRMLSAFLIGGPDPVAATTAAITRLVGFADKFLAATILSQAGYDAIQGMVVSNGWAWK